jgi:DNA adenine methylase
MGPRQNALTSNDDEGARRNDSPEDPDVPWPASIHRGPEIGSVDRRVQPGSAMPAAALSDTIPPRETRRAWPFLKWVGGKTSLVPVLLDHVPAQYRRYHEPFVGGGALFFALAPRRACLADSNAELIHAYTMVRDAVTAVLEALSRHVYERGHFEAVRALDPAVLAPAERAARFIYLNKTCFNGLWRVNRAGRFNVPFGRYRNPGFHDPDTLMRASEALRGAELRRAPFELSLERARPGDFVYLDPPYDPVSKTASFTSYTPDAFDWPDQMRLAEACTQLDARGVAFLLSNSATPRIRKLYRRFEQRIVRAPRHVSCKGGGRGLVEELLVFNTRAR